MNSETQSRSAFWIGVLLTSLCVSSLDSTLAGTSEFPSMRREGSACVTKSANTKTAFIIDGGHKGGLAATGMSPQALLAELHAEGFRNVFISCSHPHADHANGLLEIVEFQSPNHITLADFDQVVLIDSDYPSKKSLYSKFVDVHGNLDNVIHRVATNANAFAVPGLSKVNGPRSEAHVSNFVYEPKRNASIHGRSIITHTLLSKEASNNRTLIVDFDDASTELVNEWSEWAKEHLPQTQHRVYVVPHHGSDKNQIDSLLANGLLPGSVIITVNPRNRYRHPGPANWLKWIRAIGVENVHLTGATQSNRKSVVVDEQGLPPLSTTELGDVRDRILAPLIEDVDRDRYDSQLAHRFDKIVERARVLREIEIEYSEPSRRLKTYFISTLFLDPNNPGGSGHSIEPDVPGGPEPGPNSHGPGSQPPFPSNRPSGPNAGALSHGGSNLPSGKPTIDKPMAERGVTSYIAIHKRLKSYMDELGMSAPANRVDRFRLGGRLPPIFGGVVIGNEVSPPPNATLLRAAIGTRNEDRYGVDVQVCEIRFLFDVAGTGQRWFVYDQATPTELWCAYKFVNPPSHWQYIYSGDSGVETYHASPGEINVAGKLRDLPEVDGWEFGIHPALVDTPLASNAMDIDMLPVAILRFAEPHKEVRQLLDRFSDTFSSYQWADCKSQVQLQGDRIGVAGKEGEKQIMTIRFWSAFTDSQRKKLKEINQAAKGHEDQSDLDRMRTHSQTLMSLAEISPIGHTVKGDTTAFVGSLYQSVSSLQKIDRFARIVALLNYVSDSNVRLPPLPGEIAPASTAAPPELAFAELMGRTSLTDMPAANRTRFTWLALLLFSIAIVAAFVTFKIRGNRELCLASATATPDENTPITLPAGRYTVRTQRITTETSILSCSNCSRRLRIPKNKGVLNVNCPACKHTFEFDSSTQNKIIPCPTCKRRLRLPTNRGELAATCPDCGDSFDFCP